MMWKRYGSFSVVCARLPLRNEVTDGFFFTVTDVQLASMALSSTRSPGVVNSSYSAGLQNNDIGTMMDNQDLTTPSEIFPPSDLVAPEDFGLYQDWMQPMNSFDDINVNPVMELTSSISQMSPNYETTTRVSMPIQRA